MYRFALSPRWIGLGLGMILLAVVMVGLGLWQLDRYHQRSAINHRIDDATAAAPVPLTSVLPPPPSAGAVRVGPAPRDDQAWTKVTLSGRYDVAHQILARARTVNHSVGFEILTPLVLADGSAVVVDRGWLPPGATSASVPPAIPLAPTGPVSVVGRVHAPESGGSTPESFAGTLAVRRIAPADLAAALPYPLYGAYITLESQMPAANAAFVGIRPDHENAAMNAGYVVQWWMFAGLTLFGFVYLVYREGRIRAEAARPPGSDPWDQVAADSEPRPSPKIAGPPRVERA